MELSIVPLYAAAFGLGLVALSVRVIRLRRRSKVPLGGGGQPALERAIRVQANFSEYVPLAIILLAFVELDGQPDLIVHGLCVLLAVGRGLHALGVSRTAENYRYRVFGMAATFVVLSAASLILLAGGSLLTGTFS